MDQLEDEDERLSPIGRLETIALLSRFSPDYAVVNALIGNLNVVDYGSPDDAWGSERPRGYIARRVLAHFGKFAEDHILFIIGTEWHAAAQLENASGLRSARIDASKVEGFAGVLTRIEGKANALLKLQDAQAKAKNPKVKAQFQAVIEAVKKGERNLIQF